MNGIGFYPRLAKARQDSPELQQCIEATLVKLLLQDTSTKRPGILLGKIQSGKTRAFIGVIALAFDRGYDTAVVLTKGTLSLAKQTTRRIATDFKPFIDEDAVQVFDIMAMPENLTGWELDQKLVLVVKKEDDNLRRLLTAFRETYPDLRQKKLLIIDDEADYASLSFRRTHGQTTAGVISAQIDELRGMVADSGFLQVTATPYSLYLQPEEELLKDGTALFLPKRPAFTQLLPIHPGYVGGDYYFERSADPDSPEHYFYQPVPDQERDALKKPDGRRLKLENVLEEKNTSVLRTAIMNFIVGVAIRRMEQEAAGAHPEKYSFLFHTEHSKQSHEWQQQVALAIRDGLVQLAEQNPQKLSIQIREAYDDLKRSLDAAGSVVPDISAVEKAVIESLVRGRLMITTVNSDGEIEKLLDDDGQLKLRNPLNLFIGGQILDRGVTIRNLIGFYYGRNPQRFQQDTVLQHARMYGSRPVGDLPVTRFYAPIHIYQLLRKIHEFDSALRMAFENGTHDKGVYFIQRSLDNKLIPCSPNKLMFSKITSVRPGERFLPVGFQTVYKTAGKKNLEKLDQAVQAAAAEKRGQPVLISVESAVEMVTLAYENLEFDVGEEDERRAHLAILEHLARQSEKPENRGKVWLLTTDEDRRLRRIREGGRYADAPDTKQQRDIAVKLAMDIPVLLMLRQEGSEELGWRGLPFWWPVIMAPFSAVTSVFADEVPADAAAVAGA